MCQNYYFCGCSLKFSCEKENEITIESELPDSIKQKIKTIFNNHPNYFNLLVFEKAHTYGHKVQNDNELNKPIFEALYHLDIPNKLTQGAKYCIIISFDSNGNSTTFLNLPIDSLNPQKIISKKKALKLCKLLWTNNEEKVSTRLEFDKDKKIIVWHLSRFVNRAGYLSGIVQEIIINAFTGEIIEKKQAYHEVSF
jgi:hypothetical protein